MTGASGVSINLEQMPLFTDNTFVFSTNLAVVSTSYSLSISAIPVLVRLVYSIGGYAVLRGVAVFSIQDVPKL